MPQLVECGYDDPEMLELRGPQIQVQIGFDPKFKQVKGGVPSLPSTLFNALVDTGADSSSIDSRMAQKLGLPVMDRRRVIGVHGNEHLTMYLGHIHFPGLPATIIGNFAGVHLQASGLGYDALIGRDFLGHLRMVYDGSTGQVTLEKVR